ncbi:glycosyltransferase family 4 protein [Methylovirgula sp. 4M-Z18]|uniref:glycosyltransferase family 4 protein n=1 Tax=Methylovirgula sp. 4M-Z18 TaxID=2293567 RepID=UPI000E2EB3DE|nr:glycosyltransferase family 4 protein [Methylovirgula sp. 4M-Z18]RFB79527.1 glycosyltransferase [Methylovirgula sp. 4M-Z18]
MSRKLLHRAWQMLPHGFRRRLFEEISLATAPKLGAAPLRPQPPFIVAGYLTAPTGLGQSARLAIQALEAAQIPVFGIDLSATFRQSQAVTDFRYVPDRGEAGTLVLFVNPPVSSAALRAIGAARLHNLYRIGDWIWELEQTPESWRRHAPFFHELASSSRFSVDAIARSTGCPTRFLPLPVAIEPLPLAQPINGARPRICFIGDMVAASHRKNLSGLLAALNDVAQAGRAFDLRLIIRGGSRDDARLAPLLKTLEGRGCGVALHGQSLARTEQLALLAQSDLYVSLHHSEGFGLTVAEAMLMGLPCVSTDWSATAEFLDDSNGYPVRCELVPSPKTIDDDRQLLWAEPDRAHAAQQITAALADPAEARRRGAKARVDLTRMFSAKAFADALTN